MRMFWRLRTMSMFVVLTFILMALGMIISALFIDDWMIGVVIMAFISVIVCFISYYKSKELALSHAHARIVSEEECPRLYAIVREVAEKAGLPMPEIGISPEISPNAFATGRNPQNAAVVCTQGILNMLPDDELRGVIAHEMSHVKNRDILVMSIASALASIISYIARMMWWMAFFTPSSRDDNGNRLILIAVALAAQILVPIAAIMVQLGISRSREYLADETGAKIINDPRALARALDHLEKGNDAVHAYREANPRANSRDNPANDYDYAHMWIADPLKKGSLISRLFSTHPPMAERIDRLNKMAEKMGL